MRRVAKWFIIGLGGVLALLIVIALVLAFKGDRRLNKHHPVEPQPVSISLEAASIERGEYLASISCMGCHGDDLGGTNMFSEAGLGNIPAPNLTAGAGGVGGAYSDIDYVRAIRHGVDGEGRPLAIMPSRAYWHYSDEDLGAIISYLRSISPVNRDVGEREIGIMGQILIGADLLDFISAEIIDHNAARQAAGAAGASKGEYLVETNDCRQCHGADLSGGHSGEPGAPPGPDLLSVIGWTRDEFSAAMRTGVTPAGRRLDPDFMPWRDYGRMTDEDLTALYGYLASRPISVTEKE